MCPKNYLGIQLWIRNHSCLWVAFQKSRVCGQEVKSVDGYLSAVLHEIAWRLWNESDSYSATDWQPFRVVPESHVPACGRWNPNSCLINLTRRRQHHTELWLWTLWNPPSIMQSPSSKKNLLWGQEYKTRHMRNSPWRPLDGSYSRAVNLVADLKLERKGKDRAVW